VLSMLIDPSMGLSLDSHYKVSSTIMILAAYKVQASSGLSTMRSASTQSSGHSGP
jgi:hypothetical protein